ncbi:MAG: YbjN domain-containing protein [bacterium]|nr:YbjN domain-containing protein [bacterium]
MSATDTPQNLIDEARAKIKAVLEVKYPSSVDFGDGSFAVPYGSSSVAIVVREYTKTDTMVELMAQVVSGGTIDAEVTKWLLRKNAELHFGAFGLLFDDTIIFTYSLPGTCLESQELESAINSVSIIADYYDDELIKMVGGKRVADLA